MFNRSYIKSNRKTEVKLQVTNDAKYLFQKILLTTSDREREFYADGIINDLCQSFEIPLCNVKIQNRNQAHGKDKKGRLRVKTLGYYLPKLNTIVIYNRTAIQMKVVAGKTFFRCLIHEFMHHYDYHKLKINSLHTTGFYKRINSILEKFLE